MLPLDGSPPVRYRLQHCGFPAGNVSTCLVSLEGVDICIASHYPFYLIPVLTEPRKLNPQNKETTDIRLRHHRRHSFIYKTIFFLLILTYVCDATGAGWLSPYSTSVRVGRSGDRIPVGAIFSAPVHTGPGAHPASNTMGTGSFPGVKRPERGVDHQPHLAPRLKKELYLVFPFGSS